MSYRFILGAQALRFQQIIQEKVRTALSYLIGRAHVLCTFRTVPVCLQACCILRVYVNAGPTCIQK